jgi:hypothetical protein
MIKIIRATVATWFSGPMPVAVNSDQLESSNERRVKLCTLSKDKRLKSSMKQSREACKPRTYLMERVTCQLTAQHLVDGGPKRLKPR